VIEQNGGLDRRSPWQRRAQCLGLGERAEIVDLDQGRVEGLGQAGQQLGAEVLGEEPGIAPERGGPVRQGVVQVEQYGGWRHLRPSGGSVDARLSRTARFRASHGRCPV